MALRSSNPTLKDKVFEKAAQTVAPGATGVMTVNGSIIKTFLLLGMAIIAAAFTWRMAYTSIDPDAVFPWIIGGAIGGFVMALVVTFKPTTAPWAAPIYAALEGLFLGAITAFFEMMFPGIAITAIAATMLTTLVMLTLYRSGVIKVTQRFRSIIFIAIASIAVFYLARLVFSLFGVILPFGVGDSSLISIGISVVIVVVAALSLMLDFDFIERGAAMEAPKYMEWYGAFGLMVTIVWLYLEILKLLAKIAARD